MRSDAGRAIVNAVVKATDASHGEVDPKAWLNDYIYRLSLTYVDQIGALPGFTDSESDTRLERPPPYRRYLCPSNRRLMRNWLRPEHCAGMRNGTHNT